MNIKWLLFMVAICSISTGCSGVIHEQIQNGDTQKLSGKEKPEIIDIFACSDYCPGPKEQHMVRAYKGVGNASDCARVGGTPREYIGWGTHFVCLAE